MRDRLSVTVPPNSEHGYSTDGIFYNFIHVQASLALPLTTLKQKTGNLERIAASLTKGCPWRNRIIMQSRCVAHSIYTRFIRRNN
jgi:hypothetical protein